ncbi:hypothetical protein C8035_v007048 [Colletotrichum spinosum]|uniref:Uncharacterized protein n=1 Tax=Colletotrichum spinosum TaxID=1347390 RepID=A0A4V3HT04_9PEZI|nr:hypothetical protein C8035_v007048 [Colletotrichum spinosum]
MQITQITKLFALALLSVGVSADQEGPLSCWHTMEGCNNHCNSVGTCDPTQITRAGGSPTSHFCCFSKA